jgi:hypothetical protein
MSRLAIDPTPVAALALAARASAASCLKTVSQYNGRRKIENLRLSGRVFCVHMSSTVYGVCGLVFSACSFRYCGSPGHRRERCVD